MKKRWKFGMAALLVAVVLAACSQQADGIDVEYLWSMEQIKAAEDMANSMGGLLLSYQTTMYVKPPFYQGEMPLKFIAAGKKIGGGMMGSSLSAAFVYDFGSWRNYFIYNDMNSMIHGLPDGAIAVDSKTKLLIAECKVQKRITREKRLVGFELVENHYNMEGKAIFTSVFEVDFQQKHKTRELQSKGMKQRDYFFIWPNGMAGGF